jgi:hypothetical protein
MTEPSHQEIGLTEEENECSICLQEMDQLTEAGLDSCKHTFHIDCISKWGKQSSKCPLCKGNFENYLFQGGKIPNIASTDLGSDEESISSQFESENSESYEEDNSEDDEYRCSVCGVDDDLMGRRLFCSHHCGSYAHVFCLGPPDGSSDSSERVTWVCIDCTARQRRAESRHNARRRAQRSNSAEPGQRVHPPVPAVPDFLAPRLSPVIGSAGGPPDLSIHWAEREIALRMQQLAARRQQAGSMLPPAASNLSTRTQHAAISDSKVPPRKLSASSLANDIARELANEDRTLDTIKREHICASDSDMTNAPVYKRPRRRQDQLSASSPIFSSAVSSALPIPPQSISVGAPPPVGRRESSASSSSTSGSSSGGAMGDLLRRALLGDVSSAKRSTSSTHDSVASGSSCSKGGSNGASNRPSSSLPLASQIPSSSGGYKRVVGTSSSTGYVSISGQQMGSSLYGCPTASTASSTLASSSAAARDGSADLSSTMASRPLHVTSSLSSRVQAFMTPLWDALQVPVDSYQSRPSSDERTDQSLNSRDLIIDKSISSMIPKIFSLCTYHDTSFLTGLLDAGILNVMNEYITELLRSRNGGSVISSQHIEILLRVANWLPIRAKHVMIVTRSGNGTEGGEATKAQFNPFVRTLLRIAKQSHEGTHVSSKLYTVTEHVLQNLIAILHRFPHAKSRLQISIAKSK